MSENTKIEWAHHTFNPWIGCTKVSEACRNCYAENYANRYGRAEWGKGKPRSRTSDANWRKPLAWDRKAAAAGERHRVFCASLADIFDEEVSDTWRLEVFALITKTPNLDWLLLTKRPEKMRAFMHAIRELGPLDNVWLGVTVDDQATADARIPILLSTPAAKRFLSVEPLLGPIDLGLRLGPCPSAKWFPGGEETPERPYPWASRWIHLNRIVRSDIPTGPYLVAGPGDYRASSNAHGALCVLTPSGPLGVKPAEFEVLPAIDWVIVGGESGPGARPMHPDWARSLRDQCEVAVTAFMFKQWGAWAPAGEYYDTSDATHVVKRDGTDLGTPQGGWANVHPNAAAMRRFGKKAAGRELDGCTWDEVPS